MESAGEGTPAATGRGDHPGKLKGGETAITYAAIFPVTLKKLAHVAHPLRRFYPRFKPCDAPPTGWAVMVNNQFTLALFPRCREGFADFFPKRQRGSIHMRETL